MVATTIEWKGDKVRLIDQTLLPNEERYLELDSVEAVAEAIKVLRVRGAPAIGIAAAMGLVQGLRPFLDLSKDEFLTKLDEVAEYLKRTRPTAVNLAWAVDRMKRHAYEKKRLSNREILDELRTESIAILEEDREMCRKMGEYGATLIKDNSSVLTHCNAGGLATAQYGTALAGIYFAHEAGKRVRVFADETRPLLQGARLTTWELMKAGIDVTLISDSMAAQVMKERKIDIILVGSDRIARNGDAANKIGTYGLAILAKEHNIPFYVVAPASTFDVSIPTGNEIPIEERPAHEIIKGFGRVTAPENVKVYSPAFDVTPHKYITAIVTDRGILQPPYEEKIVKLFG